MKSFLSDSWSMKLVETARTLGVGERGKGMTSAHYIRKWGCAFALAAASTLVAGGCGDVSSPTGMPEYVHEGRVVVLMHDAPVDSLKEVWLTVNSVRFIGAGNGKNTTILDEPVRLNFLDLDSSAVILAAAPADVGSFSKIRLEVSDPEFVDQDFNVIDASQIKLVANGKIDLNFQGPVTVNPGEETVVDVDLNLETSIKVNQTGNGKYILNPQFKAAAVEDTTTEVIPIEVQEGTIIRVNATLGTIDLELPGSPAILVVYTNESTVFTSASGVLMLMTELRPASQVRILGYYDPATGNFVATEVQSL